jgi:hypothetical protein
MKKELLESILAAPAYVVCSMEQMPPPEAPAEDFIRDAVFYSGAKVERYDWWTGETYDLSFKMGGADLSALNAEAPVLNGHESCEAEDVIGVIQSAKQDKRGYVATMRFSNREEVCGIRQDIADGILRNVSMGVQIQTLTLVEDNKKTGRKHYMAEAWKPFEISVVPIGADPGAKFLSKDTRLERLRSIDLSATPGAASKADDSAARAEYEYLRLRAAAR